MKTTWTRLLCALIWFGTCIGISSAAHAQTDYRNFEAQPALWTLSDADSTVYLFGTIHVMPEGLDWKTSAIEAALADSEAVMFEIDLFSPQGQQAIAREFSERGFNTSSVPLMDMISPEALINLQTLEAQVRASNPELPAGALISALNVRKPWLAYLMVVLETANLQGYSQSQAIETQLHPLVKDKTFLFAETVAEQIDAFDTLGLDRQTEILEIALDEAVNDPGALSELVQIWARGDMAGLGALLTEDMQTEAPELYQSLIVQRNLNWMDDIQAALARSDDVFVAVGAAHMVGPDGLVVLLQSQGLNVSRLD